MNQDVRKQLKKLRSIEPDSDFLRVSRGFILSAEKRKPGLRWGAYLAGLTASFGLILLVILGYFFLPARSRPVPIASAETLNKELEDMSVNITLQGVSYNNQVNQTITNTVSAITSNRAPHLNPTVLESEVQKVASTTTGGTDSQIDDLLNQVMR